MSHERSPELRQAVHQWQGNQPLRVVDREPNTVYVLMRADDFDQVRAVLREDEAELADTYAAQSDAALRAGWDAPGMDDYDRYDENRKKLCP